MLRRHFIASLFAAATIAVAKAAEQKPGSNDNARSVPAVGGSRPVWKVGDQWVVETATRAIQSRTTLGPQTLQPIRWQFEVQAVEKVGNRDCFRVEVRCLDAAAKAPDTTFWVDCLTHALTQIQSKVPSRDGVHTLTECYEFADGQPSPVIGPFPALPIDMPVFLSNRTRSAGTFTYESRLGLAKTRAIGDVGFAFAVEQDQRPLKADELKRAQDAPLFKADADAWAVLLKDPHRKVFQVWQSGQPWPVLAENGSTVSQLISVTRLPRQ